MRRLALAGRGAFSGDEVEPSGMLPDDTNKNPSLFSLARFQERDTFFTF